MHLVGFDCNEPDGLVWKKEEAVFHVIERCQGSVARFLKKIADGSFARSLEKKGYTKDEIQKEILRIKKSLIISIANGVNELHKRGIIHRDLKLDNILLVRDPIEGNLAIKIIDFGLGVRTTDEPKEKEFRKKLCGSPFHFAPERGRANESQLSNDIWGLGMICFEIWFGKLPPLKICPEVMDTLRNIVNLKQTEVDAWYEGEKISPATADDRKFIDIIQSMLKVDPSERSKAEDLILKLNAVVVGKR